MSRPKIPNRVTFTARADKELIAQVDAAVDARKKALPSFNRTDALHLAFKAWVAAEAAEAAKRGAS